MFRISKACGFSLTLAAFCSLIFSIHPAAAKQRKPQALWVGGNLDVSVFQGAALETGGDVTPELAFAPKNYANAISMTFDRHENLWLTGLSNLPGGDVAVMEITPADIASLKNGKRGKCRLVRPDGVGVINLGWIGIGFDAGGNLWLTNVGRQLLKLRSTDLIQSHPRPSIVISSMAWFPGAIRFDGSDNLWMGVSGARLWRFTPTDRAVSGPANPSLEINLPDGLIPEDFAFDTAGNLWLAGPTPAAMGTEVDEIEMIKASDLTSTGIISPPAAVTITSAAFSAVTALGSGSCLDGLDFDHSGDLWVDVVGADAGTGCSGNSQVVEFTPAQLDAGGNLEPTVSLGETSTEFDILAGPIRFGPALKRR